MNGKQSKMLRRMRATHAERREWRAMTADQRGRLRAAYDRCEWMAYPSMRQAKRLADYPDVWAPVQLTDGAEYR